MSHRRVASLEFRISPPGCNVKSITRSKVWLGHFFELVAAKIPHQYIKAQVAHFIRIRIRFGMLNWLYYCTVIAS